MIPDTVIQKPVDAYGVAYFTGRLRAHALKQMAVICHFGSHYNVYLVDYSQGEDFVRFETLLAHLEVKVVMRR